MQINDCKFITIMYFVSMKMVLFLSCHFVLIILVLSTITMINHDQFLTMNKIDS